MECKFDFKNNFGFFCKFYNFFYIWQMRLMTFATVLWMKKLRFKSIDKYEIWQMRHMTYDMTKHSRKKKGLKNNNFLFVWNANLSIYKEMQLWMKKKFWTFFVNLWLFRHLTDGTDDNFMNKTIYIWFNLQVWNLK